MTIELTHSKLTDPTREEINNAHSNAFEAVCYLKGTTLDYSEHEEDLNTLEQYL